MKIFRKGAKKVGKLQFFKKRNKNQKQSVECWNGVKMSAEGDQICTGRSPWVIVSILIIGDDLLNFFTK